MRHCAKFTDDLLPVAVAMLDAALEDGVEDRILDPFAGTGKGVARLRANDWNAWGVELEPVDSWDERYAEGFIVQGSALDLPFGDGTWDAIFTSPTYGNRFADRDMRESCAGTYMKSLQRAATEGSSCHLQWGPKYRAFHEQAWAEAWRVTKDGGHFLLNCKDHYRNNERQRVVDWHVETLIEFGYTFVVSRQVPCPGQRNGANRQRIEHEDLVLLRKGA